MATLDLMEIGKVYFQESGTLEFKWPTAPRDSYPRATNHRSPTIEQELSIDCVAMIVYEYIFTKAVSVGRAAIRMKHK